MIAPKDLRVFNGDAVDDLNVAETKLIMVKRLRIAVIVETTDDKIRQVALNRDEAATLEEFLKQLHGGVIKVAEQTLEGIEMQMSHKAN